MKYLGTATLRLFTARLDPSAAGCRAEYHVRYVNTRGERGAWGDVARATVAA